MGSPYLKAGRLADIIHAVTAMGLHPWAGKSESEWERKLGKPLSADTGRWGEVFSEHPEFFRVRSDSNSDSMSDLISLQLRHTYHWDYDGKNCVPVSPDEANSMRDDRRETDLTFKPLKIDEIGLLLKAAMELHSRAIADEEANRWWKVARVNFLFTVIGALIVMAAQRLLST